MASSRLPRFIMEVAPPQFVTVMRQRTRTMLDTINEEDNLDGSKSLSSTTIPAGATMATAATAASSSSATTTNLLAVSAPLPPLSLSGHLGALASCLGCFPLNNETYPPSSHRPTSTAVILMSYLIFRVYLNLVPLLWPAPKQCFTPRCTVNYCASTHFEGNQLALCSSGVSPLTTTHPLILQHQSVRTST
ncbi:hypothetical protein Goshw_017846 [Gossypium schwendimanii]|uniref:Uncharacterized protein n=1 Tax=Gossypium schwendimanii TaxID=34291 RepID=A0A7J9MIP1_GOSSC|nr:hypothetical protein [Gossypium schwendimanii]